MAADKMKGTVKWFNETKGFGFITGDADVKDYFVHFSSMKTDAGGFSTLSEGQHVEFTAASEDYGKLLALDVTVLTGDGEEVPNPK